MPSPQPHDRLPPSAPNLPALPRLLACGMGDHRGNGPVHRHGALEVVLVLRGPYSIAIDGRLIAGDAGSLFILPAEVAHAVRADGRWRSIYLVVRQGEPQIDQTARVLDARRDPLLRRWFEDLHQLGRETTPADQVVDALLLAVLARIAALEHRDSAATSMHPALARAVRRIASDLAGSLDVHELARIACVSYSHLCLLFRQRLGCSPLEHQRRLRLERARRLLPDPYLAIKAIAARCGYPDSNHFARAFRKEHGVAPGAWRAGQRRSTAAS